MKPIAVVTGGSSGLGLLLSTMLKVDYAVVDWSLETGVDVSNHNSILIASQNIEWIPKIDVLVNCAGYNYLEWIEKFPQHQWDMVLGANAKAILLCTKALLPKMQDGTICNIISNASHVAMTHSIAYNASKAAAAIMTRQMAKELFKTHNVTVFGVSPNKMRGTRMTQGVDYRAAELRKMTEDEAHKYQLSKILIGEETDPAVVAEFIAWLLSKKERHKYLAGCIMEYGV
jgi:NAD(P)-dependent dehydrogenase (short-subunit alcohol dehydrogenase family)